MTAADRPPEYGYQVVAGALARHRLPVTVVVLDDHAYGAEIHHLRRHGLPEELADFPPCDLAAAATALGPIVSTWSQPRDQRLTVPRR